jgi:hypothetical protein
MLRKSSAGGLSRRRHRAKEGCFAETLEARMLLSTVTVNAGTIVRTVPGDMVGINTAPWDGLLNSAQTLSLSQAAGLNAVRIGGGSTADTVHFNSMSGQQSGGTFGQAATYAASVNSASTVVTVDYGQGSPQEAAALLAYYNGSTTSTLSLGMGEEWNTSTSSWQMVNWQTVGYWASLRAATPLGTDDGLNFLRINHAAAFNFQYWEIGNEVYGSWESDQHGIGGDSLPMPSGGTRAAHDPTTMISFAVQFQNLANQFDPGILIGYDSQAVDSTFSNWLTGTLQQVAAQGLSLGFIADHYYTARGPGTENDAALLGVSNTPAGGNTYNWSQRASAYDSAIHQYLGSAGNNVKLIADEVNSVSSNPGKESTSIVNGLFIADAVGSALESTGSNSLPGYQGFYVWDLHNGGVNGNNSSSLYGWRTYGDYGIIGNGSSGPRNGELSPDYFALDLASKIFQSGATLISSSEDNESAVDTFAVLEANGNLDLLVVNKTDPRLNGDTTAPPNNLPDPSLTEQFNISGFLSDPHAMVWQYGVAQDDTQATAPNFAASLSSFTTTLNESAGNFSMALPDYSMTVIQLSPLIYAAAAGSTLNINVNNVAPVAVTTSGSNIVVSEAGSQQTFGGITGVTVNGSATNNVLNFNGPLATPFTFVNNSTTTLNLNSGVLNFANATPITLGTLAIAASAGAVMPTQATAEAQLVVKALTIATGGTLDLANNELFLNYTSGADPIATIAGYLNTGYNNGPWNGVGIISSAAQSNPKFALGYADSADAGNPAGLVANQIKIMYTLQGDLNLDGAVNGVDFGVVAANFNKTITGWDAGDFNYDGIDNGVDFGALSTNFNQGIGLTASATIDPMTSPASSQPASNSSDSTTAVTTTPPPSRKPVIRLNHHHR